MRCGIVGNASALSIKSTALLLYLGGSSALQLVLSAVTMRLGASTCIRRGPCVP